MVCSIMQAILIFFSRSARRQQSHWQQLSLSAEIAQRLGGEARSKQPALGPPEKGRGRRPSHETPQAPSPLEKRGEAKGRATSRHRRWAHLRKEARPKAEPQVAHAPSPLKKRGEAEGWAMRRHRLRVHLRKEARPKAGPAMRHRRLRVHLRKEARPKAEP